MTYLNLLWHFHQPFYLVPFSDELKTIIITFRTLYNYYPMALILEKYPNFKLTFNFTPTLIKQIIGVANGDIKDISQKILFSEDGTDNELIKLFWEELPFQVKSNYQIPNILFQKLTEGKLNKQEIFDFKIWLHLLCFHPIIKKKYPELNSFIYKGIGFNEKERDFIFEKEREIFTQLIPKYKKLQESGQVEISISPFYHPILPLIYDIKTSKKTQTSLRIPEIDFSYPEDAKIQIEKSINFYYEIFGKKVLGFWPSEGSVSEEILDLFIQEDIKWIATDEGILARILKTRDKKIFEKIYLWKEKLSVFFRNRELSDLIGFVYQKWDEGKAAIDLIEKIAFFSSDKPVVLPIVLDGENPWDWYPNAGQFFLEKFYEGVSKKSDIKPLTFSESLNLDVPKENLSYFYPGSWMGNNFDNWIGIECANRGWHILSLTRRKWEEVKTKKDFDSKNPCELLLMAEGSDFFWWMSLPADPQVKLKFLKLFQTIIKTFYEIIEEKIPVELERICEGFEGTISEPQKFISPVIDGKITNFFEWSGSGEIIPEKLWLTYQPVSLPIKKVFYGYNKTYFFIRFDFKEKFKGKIKIEFNKENTKTFEVDLSGEEFLQEEIAYKEILEWKIKWENILVDTEKIYFKIILIDSEGEISYQFPPEGLFNFEKKNLEFDWQV